MAGGSVSAGNLQRISPSASEMAKHAGPSYLCIAHMANRHRKRHMAINNHVPFKLS